MKGPNITNLCIGYNSINNKRRDKDKMTGGKTMQKVKIL